MSAPGGHAHRVVYYRLADGFPESLRQNCLRQRIVLSERSASDGD